MSDLIRRQDVVDHYDCEDKHGTFTNFHSILEFVNSLPSEEPEIIRCRECKHRDVENGLCEGRGWPMQLVPDDGFCDKGERKTDG